jgi:hypothetical protein
VTPKRKWKSKNIILNANRVGKIPKILKTVTKYRKQRNWN